MGDVGRFGGMTKFLDGFSMENGSVRADPCRNQEGPNEPAKVTDGRLALVTGGAGFIGSNLLELLLELGFRVRVLDNLSTGFKSYVPTEDERVEFIEGDVRNYAEVEKAVEGVAVVFHLAAMSKVAPSLKDPSMVNFCLENNVLGTDNVLRASLAAKVGKVVYAASSTYYGNQPVPFAEDLPMTISSPYAQTKHEGELLMNLYNELYKLPTVNCRFFMVYGPRQPSEGEYAIVTGVFLKQHEDGKDLTIEGDGSHFRDFIHVSDVARGLVMAYQNEEARGVTINLGSGDAVSIKEVANMISREKQKHVPERPNDLVGTLANTCMAKHLLGFETRKEFRTEMKKQVDEILAKQQGKGQGQGQGGVAGGDGGGGGDGSGESTGGGSGYGENDAAT